MSLRLSFARPKIWCPLYDLVDLETIFVENLWITVLQSLNVLHTDVQKIDYELHAIQHSSSPVTLIRNTRMRLASPELNLKQFFVSVGRWQFWTHLEFCHQPQKACGFIPSVKVELLLLKTNNTSETLYKYSDLKYSLLLTRLQLSDCITRELMFKFLSVL